MGARIVFVHGIAQEQRSSPQLEPRWREALGGGVEEAGFPELANRIIPRPTEKDPLEIRMAYYGGLFHSPDEEIQGSEAVEWSVEENELVERLALAWIERAAAEPDPEHGEAADSWREHDRKQARVDLAEFNSSAEDQQGKRGVAREAWKRLAKLKFFARLGSGLAGTFFVPALRQVVHYLRRPEIRTEAQDSVMRLIGPETRILIGHSLGSVVAYEVARKLREPIPLLITLGSPLGLRNVVYEELEGQPPRYPIMALEWLNVADWDDFVAAEADLKDLFSAGKPPAADFRCFHVDNGKDPHNAESYLRKKIVGERVAAALA